MSAISVLIIDDNVIFARAVTHLLKRQDNILVKGVAVNGPEGLAQAQDLQPDIVLMDLVMPGVHGLNAIPILRTKSPDMGIIVLTLMDTEEYRQAALMVGANTFVSKADLDTELIPAINQVAARSMAPSTSLQNG